MLTEKQITHLLDTHKMYEGIYTWVREHVAEREYASLTTQQRETLHIILEMPKTEQRKHIIINDKLVEAPTKVQKYAKTQGKWEKRDGRMPLQYHNRKL